MGSIKWSARPDRQGNYQTQITNVQDTSKEESKRYRKKNATVIKYEFDKQLIHYQI